MARVLLDLRFRHAGPGRYASELVAGLREAASLDLVVLEAAGVRSRPFTPWGSWRTRAVARRERIDLVHGLHLELPGGPIPGVVTIQDVVPLEHPASMPSAVRRHAFAALLRASLRRAARTIVPSEATAAALARHGADQRSIAVIPLAVSPVFRPLDEAERADAQRRLARGERYVAAATGTRPHKNAAAVAPVARLLARSCGARLVPVRMDGSLADEDLRRVFGGADAFLLPSHVEGFGLPAAEALACATPVVCGPGVGALPYIGAGVLEADVSRPVEVAHALERILAEPSLRRRLVEGGLAAAARLSRGAMAQRTLGVYADVLRLARLYQP